MALFIGFLLFTAVLTSLTAGLLRKHPVRDFFGVTMVVTTIIPVCLFIQGTGLAWVYAAAVAIQTLLVGGAFAVRHGMPDASAYKTMIVFKVLTFAAIASVFTVGSVIWWLFV